MRSALSTLLLAAWLWTLALAGSPELHHWAHEDSGHGEHECAATLLVQGLADVPAPMAVAGVPCEWTVWAPIAAARAEVAALSLVGAEWPLGPPVGV